MPRLRRKNEHIYQCLHRAPRRADFGDINLVHNCLPDLDLHEIDLETDILGQRSPSPLFINALTGGTALAGKINGALAAVARDCGLPMAVGSQMAAIESSSAEKTYRVVRQVNPRGVIWANIGSYANPVQASMAVEMVEADALQIHLNIPQELAMPDGDRCFRGLVDRIEEICRKVPVPVIAKEVGFGIAREQAALLINAGVSAIDVGGRGGTNFLAIEKRRSRQAVPVGLREWGLTTALTLLETLEETAGRVEVFAAGGMQEPVDIIKALALGARAVGLAGLPVYLLLTGGRRRLYSTIKSIENQMRMIMLMLGVKTPQDLHKTPLVISGSTAAWMERRGMEPAAYGRNRSDRGLEH